MTSISKIDDLVEGKSYYLVEADSLLEMINSLDNSVPSLCIIDEIFRGTNSVERINADVEFFRYLAKHNCLAVVASHDLEIAKMQSDGSRLFHFSEIIGGKGLEFDYRLKEGVTKTWNAVKLLKFLGYPDEIVEGATKRINDMIHIKNEA